LVFVMAREFEPWEMPDNVRAALDSGMRNGLYQGIGRIRTTADVQALQAQLGRERLTGLLAGTTDKSSRAWKNARDNLRRYRTGARGLKGAAPRLQGAAEQARRDRIRNLGTLHVTVRATVRTSRTEWDGKMDADLTGGDLVDFLDAADRGAWEAAAQIVIDAYGLDPDLVLELTTLDSIDYDLPADWDEED
jgi:hypothetical protein